VAAAALARQPHPLLGEERRLHASLDRVLQLVTTCLADEQEYVANAVGWVLRETGHAYPDEVRAFLEEHVATISPVVFRRAIERRSTSERAELRALRAAALT
jgi:3-methyladenine DNA glycosylase AlkD